MKMKADKKKKLEEAGWQVSDTSGFLGLNAEEQAYFFGV